MSKIRLSAGPWRWTHDPGKERSTDRNALIDFHDIDDEYEKTVYLNTDFEIERPQTCAEAHKGTANAKS